MSLDFKLHYDRLRENDPTKPEAAAEANEVGTFYEGPSHARNLCLVWPDGKQQFLNYAYLVGGTFSPGEEMNEIKLDFSSYLVTIQGHYFEHLFAKLLEHLVKSVVQIDSRYKQNVDDKPLVVYLKCDKI